MLTRAFVLALSVFISLSACGQPQPAGESAAAGRFRITLDPSVSSKPYSGRVYVALSEYQQPEPRRSLWNWWQPGQVFAVDVSNIAPGGTIEIDAAAISYPKPYKEASKGSFWVQAVARNNPDGASPGADEGDLYSQVAKVTFTPGDDGVLSLTLSKAVPARKFPAGERVKLLSHPSAKLTAFLNRDFTMNAGVVLPKSWKEGDTTTYPVLVWIGGYGGDHFGARQFAAMTAAQPLADNVIVVVPDPTCFRGHTVFADSANNGPRGAALVDELLPAVEAKFRGNGKRYVSGISSGGWASLWLQVAYPDTFRGTWSHCPDPVDFRDFQRINLYAPDANMYKDEKGERRPLSRSGNRVTIWYDTFVAMETAMGPGGQIHSFEAVFSPKGDNGEPRPLFDRATGNVDPVTAKAWEKYDINLVLERNWATLGPKLKGRLHIYAGSVDNFYLEGAARNLKETLTKLGSDAEVTIIEGMGHNVHGQGVNAMFETIAAENK